MQQPTALAPSSQTRARGGVQFPPSSPSREGADSRLTAAAYLPFHTETGNRNLYYVIQQSVDPESYNGAQCVGQESQHAEQEVQPAGQEASATEETEITDVAS